MLCFADIFVQDLPSAVLIPTVMAFARAQAWRRSCVTVLHCAGVCDVQWGRLCRGT